MFGGRCSTVTVLRTDQLILIIFLVVGIVLDAAVHEADNKVICQLIMQGIKLMTKIMVNALPISLQIISDQFSKKGKKESSEKGFALHCRSIGLCCTKRSSIWESMYSMA